MEDIKNVIQSQSYTNRDFNSVFAELLDLSKLLCKTWDPTISNESDPGVVLLKLNALIEDKLAYATDKNVLEAFPLSVTQELNARQLFNQLGYYMGWYNSAETFITVQWNGTEPLSESCILDKFTMVTNDDSDIVYTLIDNYPDITDYNPCKMDLKSGTLKCKAMQGVIAQYSINGETAITSSMLDSNRRLYFNEKNIAQNGIFITNTNNVNYTSWKKVDNLAVESLGNYYYEFGVSNDGTTCYLEFPEDADTLFSNGINIHYLKTLGESGNINAGTMSKMYSSVKTESGILLDSSNTKISNIYSATNGKNPETINEAYAGYKKIKGTFNTLVTLRDYINYIISSGLVSNGFVCDRTNDIQSVTRVMSYIGGVNQLLNVVDVNSEGKEKLDAFSLKLYLLNYASISDLDEITVASTKYNSTFNMHYSTEGDKEYSTDETINVKNYISDSKCMQHDYKALDLIEKDASGNVVKPNICLFKNYYPITCTIIPQYSLTAAQITEVKNAVKLALYKAFNSLNVEFGAEISYDYIKEVIEKAHDRIKSISLNPITYETYAVYFEQVDNKPTLKEVLVSSESADLADKNISKAFRKDIFTKSVIQGVTPFYIKDTEFDYKINQYHDETIPGSNVVSDGIYEISTETQVTFKNEYTCRENETIQLYSPNLLTTDTYSNRCVYEHVLSNDINENVNHELTANEYIIIYWKSAESDGNYQYKIYEEGSIICPNFLLLKANNSTDANAKIRYDDLKIGVNISKWSTWVSENLTGDHILTSSKQIDIKKLNQITLDNSYYCYWITNTIKNDKYILTFGDSKKYTLGENEFFFYTSSAATDLVILGQGTELVYDESGEFEVSVLDSDTIFNEGLSALSDIWYQFESDLKVTENKIIDLPVGYTLKYLFTDSAEHYLTLNKAGAVLDKNAVIKYIDTQGNEIVLENLDISGAQWSAKILIGLNIDKNDKIHLLAAATGDNIKASETTALKITYYYDVGSERKSGSKEGDKYIISSIPINISGQATTNDIRILEDDEYKYAKFYIYRNTLDTSTGGVNAGNQQLINKTIEITDSLIKIKIEKSDAEKQYKFKFKLPAGKYIYYINQTKTLADDAKLTLSIRNDAEIKVLPEIGQTTGANMIEAKKYYLYSNYTPDAGGSEFIITAEKISQGFTLNIQNPLKFEYPDSSILPCASAEIESKIIEFINTNDIDFNFLYQPDDEDKVENPLDAYSFINNPNHIYNKFTICQLNTKSLKNLLVTGK